MKRQSVLLTSVACALLVGAAGAAPAPCGTNACPCVCAKDAPKPPRPPSLKLESSASDAEIAAFKTAVLARIDEAVKAAKAAPAKETPSVVRVFVDDGRHSRPHGFGHGQRPEPPRGEPPRGEPPRGERPPQPPAE